MRSTVLSLLFIFLVLSSSAQEGKQKYLRQNEKAPIISYAENETYARGIFVDSPENTNSSGVEHRVFTANASGEVYVTYLPQNTSKKLVGLDELKELRDIDQSGGYYLAMKSGDNGKIFRFNSHGETELIQSPDWDSTFFDGFDFIGTRGFLMGDPIDGVFELYHTENAGKTWTRCPTSVNAFDGEAGFAASGTNVQVLNDSTYIFVSGGSKSRFFRSTNNGLSWTNVVLPYYQEPSSGAFSVCFMNDSIGVIVGGDYLQPDLRLNTSFYTTNGGQTWYNSTQPLRGYRSCVFEYNSVFYACGTNGIDVSLDNGRTWIPFADGNYFALSATPSKLVATRKNGEVQLFDLIKLKK